MPHMDWTISLGSLLSAVSVIGACVVFFVRMGEIQRQQTEILRTLRDDFRDHQKEDNIRFEKLETRIIDLISGLQRLIGQMELFRRNPR